MPRKTAPLLVTLFALITFCPAAQAAPGGKELKKAEAVMDRLRRLEAAASGADSRAFRESVEELYPAIFVRISGLGEGDAKTDMATAASLYEAAHRARLTPAAHARDCGRELRDSYLRLCREQQGRDLAQLLLAKARLHTRWAEAALRHARGERDAETLAALRELRAERDLDIALAGRALLTLKRLAESARPDSEAPPPSESEDAGALALTDAELSDALDGVDLILASLPRGRVYVLLRNARNSLRDGLSWRLKAHRSRSLTVSANSLHAPDPLRLADMNADTAARTTLHNWRGARNFVRRAEEAMKKD